MTSEEERALRSKISREILHKGAQYLVTVEDPSSLWNLAVKICAKIAREGTTK